jgi:hypothetical protein
MADLLLRRPLTLGIATFLLMEADWVLTILQQRARATRPQPYQRTYPVDTVEGNPLLRRDVGSGRLLSVRHLTGAILVSGILAWLASEMRPEHTAPVLGAVWGTFLIVIETHVRNIVAYAASRVGMHGKLHVHQRTAYRMSIGRYAGTLVFVSALTVLDPTPFLLGVCVAAAITIARQLIFMRRVPPIPVGDPSPAT